MLETSLEGETEVESQRIGEMTMALLRKIDEIAYVRFASVYRKFNTAQDFTEILRAMAESNAAGRE